MWAILLAISRGRQQIGWCSGDGQPVLYAIQPYHPGVFVLAVIHERRPKMIER
ncbi:hypothetical protein NB231_09068 [Nitrococcus mobilis Nb-231]|uniref:Uncharacterized protein n=1 Tax=Nitrococcus mobilis Nb-231 TaxID=314278 RepID=A4BMZ1_9GAMM|nr:hypothetical protein NB231_09068 [Nitrococcus mobilis Nb-231]